MLSFSEFCNYLLLDKYDNIYIFVGEEVFFHEEGVLLLRKKLRVPDISWHVVYADETPIKQLFEIIYASALFSKINVTQVRNLSYTPKNYKEQLVDILTKNTSQSNIVILHLNVREAVFTRLKAKWISCQLPKDKSLPNFLVALSKEKFNKNLTTKAALLLCDLLKDCDILALEKEIEKLSIFVSNKDQISEEAVLSLTAALNNNIIDDLEKLLKDNILPKLPHIEDQDATKLLSNLTYLIMRRVLKNNLHKLYLQLKLLSIADLKIKTTSPKLHALILAFYIFKLYQEVCQFSICPPSMKTDK